MARDWIRLQNQSQLTYTTLLQHSKILEQCCEQFQKAQLKGCAELTTLSVATATASSVHQDTITTHNAQCMKCGYKTPLRQLPCDRQGMLKLAWNRPLYNSPQVPKIHQKSQGQAQQVPPKKTQQLQSNHSPSRHRQSHHKNTNHSPFNTCR